MFTSDRFKGCPVICDATNLPSFESRAAGNKFNEVNAPSTPIHKVWQCKECMGWHFWGSAPYPAGASSGSTRDQDAPPHILKVIKETELN